MDTTFNLLTSRVDSLEYRICGRIEEAEQQQSLIDSLIKLNQRIQELTAGKELFHEVNAKLDPLNDVLSHPESVDMSHDVIAKKELLLSEEPRLLTESKLLQQVKQLEAVMDSAALRDHDVLTPALNDIRAKTMQQLEESRRINSETQKLISVYSQLMEVVKERLTSWDKKIKAAELAARSEDPGKRRRSRQQPLPSSSGGAIDFD